MRTLQAVWNSVRDVWEIPGTASLLCGHLGVYSGTWPTSGTMRNGAAYALPTWADRMQDSASSSSPLFGTPRAHWLGRGYLTAQVLLLPTPEAKLADSGPDFARAGREGSGGNDLTTALALLPTPAAADGSGGRLDAEKGGVRPSGVRRSVSLATALQHDVLLPTVTQDGKNNGGPSQFERNTPPLNTAVLMLPTPRASDGEKGGPNQRGSKGDKTMPSVAAGMGPDWGDYAPAIERWEAVMGPAPSPVVPGPKGGPRLSPAFTEWMMGQPAGWITDPAIGISRNEQIKACGNGVVTQQAVAALVDMLEAEAAA